MKNTLSKSDFIDGIKSIRPDNFSYYALEQLFNYFEEYEESCDTEIEFDPIAICCEYSEFESIKEVAENYDIEEDTIEDYLQTNTLIVCFEDDCIVIADF